MAAGEVTLEKSILSKAAHTKTAVRFELPSTLDWFVYVPKSTFLIKLNFQTQIRTHPMCIFYDIFLIEVLTDYLFV